MTPPPRVRPPTAVRPPGTQRGSLAVAQAAVLCVVMLLVGLATVPSAGLLRAARVAGAAADGAALAAVSATQPGATTTPRAAAEGIARAHGARLATCRCGGPTAHVRVTLAVESRLLGLLGITAVHAEADAALVPEGGRTRALVHSLVEGDRGGRSHVVPRRTP